MYRSIDYDVVVVGAGLSGLTAAFTLLDKDPSLNVLVLEAKNHVGGRIYSPPIKVANGVACFDLGGEWINREHKNILELIEKLNLPVVTCKRVGNIMVNFHNRIVPAKRKRVYYFLNAEQQYELKCFVERVERYCKAINNESLTNFKDTTVYNFIRANVRSSAVKMVLEEMILRNFAVPSSELSLMYYLYYCMATIPIASQLLDSPNQDDYVSIKGGAETLCKYLVRIIDKEYIVKESRVSQIVQNEDCVQVVTVGGNTYMTRYVVVAIPPRDLVGIQYYPPLRKTNIRRTSIINGVVTKFVVTYPTKFWKDRGASGEMHLIDDRDDYLKVVQYCYDVSKSKGSPALAGVIIGENEASMKERVLQQLAECFGKAALRPISYYEKSWNESSGCLAYCWGVNNTQYLEELYQAPTRVYFAGAETSRKWPGLMEGAVETGIRSGLEILYIIRPSLLETFELEQLSYVLKNWNKNEPLPCYLSI